MAQYEYRVVPAPTKGTKAKGVKTPEGRFALTVQSVLNTLGAEGWEYLRAELLPSDERTGLTGSTTNWRNVLVFRREIAPVVSPAPTPQLSKAAEAESQMASGAERMLKDDGVEELSPVSGMTTALKSRAAQQAEDGSENSPEDGPENPVQATDAGKNETTATTDTGDKKG